MTDEQFTELKKELAEIKKLQWSKEFQEQLVKALTEMTNVMRLQTKVTDKQVKNMKRMDNLLNELFEKIHDDYEPEEKPEILPN